MTDTRPDPVMSLADEAQALMKSCPLIGTLLSSKVEPSKHVYTHSDGHNDFPYMVRGWHCNDLKSGLETLPIGQTDMARLGKSGLGGQFWSAFVPRCVCSFLDRSEASTNGCKVLNRTQRRRGCGFWSRHCNKLMLCTN